MSYEAPEIRLLGTVAELTETGDQWEGPKGSVTRPTLPIVIDIKKASSS